MIGRVACEHDILRSIELDPKITHRCLILECSMEFQEINGNIENIRSVSRVGRDEIR